jgi:CBS domain-containing protein
MQALVGDIMKPEIVTLRPEESVEDALLKMRAASVPVAAVIDVHGCVVGIGSARDLSFFPPRATVAAAMVRQAMMVDVRADIPRAADLLAAHGRRHLVVAGATGRPVGIVSVLDVLRALRGDRLVHDAGRRPAA